MLINLNMIQHELSSDTAGFVYCILHAEPQLGMDCRSIIPSSFIRRGDRMRRLVTVFLSSPYREKARINGTSFVSAPHCLAGGSGARYLTAARRILFRLNGVRPNVARACVGHCHHHLDYAWPLVFLNGKHTRHGR